MTAPERIWAFGLPSAIAARTNARAQRWWFDAGDLTKRDAQNLPEYVRKDIYDAARAEGFKAGIEAAANIMPRRILADCIRAIPVPASPGPTLTPDEVRQVREALELHADGCVDARTARAALAILDAPKS